MASASYCRRWSLVPSWWSRTLKEMTVATFAPVEVVAQKPTFRDAFKRTRWLIPPAGHDRMPVILNPINLSCGSLGERDGNC
jgi:putative SOS response-associated peptidase YedK